jgi:hypothetical protein
MPRDRRHMSGTVYAPSRWVPHVGGVGSSAQKKDRDGARCIPPLLDRASFSEASRGSVAVIINTGRL